MTYDTVLSKPPPQNKKPAKAPDKTPASPDPYIGAGVVLSEAGFFRIYDKGAIRFFSTREELEYNFTEIRDKYPDIKIEGYNIAKTAKMIDNLDPVYPVYHLVKSYAYPPRYMGKNKTGEKYVINTWRGFQFPLKDRAENPEAEAEAEFVKSHIRDILCGGSEEDYAYLCRWIAHMFQKPDIKPGVAVFAHSDNQGTGKSIIFEHLIPNMLGIDITRVFSNEEQIAEKFNAWLFESLYVVFSEQSFYNNTENIKSWITDPNQSRRDMGAAGKEERSFSRFVICTNRENSFRFEQSDRRMFVLNVSSKMALADPSVKYPYFDRLAAAVNSSAVLDAMARFFCSLDISGFNPFDIPASAKKREIIEAETDPVIDFFESVVYGEDKGCEIFPCEEIDPEYEHNYHKSRKLYETLKYIGTNGEYFIERKRLFDHWKNTIGRNSRVAMNKFTRIIKTRYTSDKLEVINETFWENGKAARNPVIIIKKAFFGE